ncbi:hypothetical protein AKJ47_02615 [candidate division MSBL1 archaeon SCGC-AAA261G05]|uniref:Butyrate kinase n=2 Tax=candidate division MSBL1 TaxID=215777 RepID=A0A133V147_9EURY|nr:hypothetical protein AKJ42_01505 [candidate division MSBL1 archaeon SCGC-AAA261C02]KXB03248.1 hypothetical protein AKJ47_02615 [candidate division MSBL1 archaeon SCGC-AAA261G05]
MSNSRVLGIDPGTRSFDLCGLEDGRVFYEESLESQEIAKDPDSLMRAIEDAMPLDLIAGPSGYGVELTYLKDLDLDVLEDWYLTYILLLKREDLKTALERNDPGIAVYSAMVDTALKMKRRDWPVCYLPGVINLPTVPRWRKFNNLDMGTVDKLCCCVLGIHDQSNKLDVPYSDVSFILVEMGFGYNAAIGVENGKIVDGVGGTMSGIGFLTSGSIDSELAQLSGKWEKSDVFTGGASIISGKTTPSELIDSARDEENCRMSLNAMLEGIEKSVASISVSTPNPKEVLISGRLSRIDEFREEIIQRLQKYAPVRSVRWLEGAKKVKEAAQGYAMIVEGLIGERFSELVNWIEVKNAKGTALDYLYHPKGGGVREELQKKTPFKP